MEIGWAFSLKHTQGFTKIVPMVFYVFFGFFAAFFLSQALKHMPTSTAYAIWVGIAVIGTTIGGILFYREPATLFKFICMLLILAGVVGLKISAVAENESTSQFTNITTSN
jgi:quaternary ammonium compound-resistance protein SugE